MISVNSFSISKEKRRAWGPPGSGSVQRPGGSRIAAWASALLCACSCACAGPATPLGAVWTWTPVHPDSVATESAAPGESDPTSRIRFSPGRQVLHGPAPVKVLIRDEVREFDPSRLEVRYNGLDVTRSFLAQSRVAVEPERGHVNIENPVIRLPADAEHRIEMRYRTIDGATVAARYEPPVCQAFGLQRVRDTGAFRPSLGLLRAIDRLALEGGLNPAFFTALIAQESGFDPRQVSWSRAIGLTQITQAAAAEIARDRPAWPWHPGLAGVPALRLRLMVTSGELNASNEWRLDPEKSIEGGVAYARRMAERWGASPHAERVRQVFADPEVATARLALASYHSGFARTLGAFNRRGAGFLDSPELNEARRYVNRIFSYCHHFSEEAADEGGLRRHAQASL
jgi:hypothetical protein